MPLNFPGWIRNAWLSVLAVLNGRRKHRGWGRFLLILVTGLTGFELQAGNVAYVDLGQPARLWRGRSEASSPDPGAWRGVGFVDETWERVAMPVFSGLALAGTELADMPGQYSSIFVRRTFVVNEPAAVLTLELGTFCTGGCIAWINGQEVYRTNVPAGDPVLGGVAGGTNGTPAAFVTQELALTPGLLVGGTNVLAIQAFARAPGPGWSFVFDTSLTAIVDEEPPVMVDLVPEAGRALRELNFVEVVFSEPVTGVTAEDLLINDHPATNVVEVAAGDFLFAIDPPADGLVTLAWRAGHDITDTGPLHRPFAGGSWHYTVDSTSPASDVVISEFMADNKRTLHDEDGDSPDWIELYNGGANTASLAGWFLTDSRTNPTKWTFPAVDLPAGGYLVVYASAKNRVNPLGRLHTNFKLGSDGGYLALFDSRTNLASDFGASYPRQSTDVSYGRAPGENRAVGYFTKPTPGALNVSSGPGFAPAVEFSQAGGPFTNAFALVLRTGLSNAIIRYTLDGSLPTNSSPVFSAPIAVTNSLQVRARAFADGLLPGPPRSEAYLLLSTNVLGFSSDLPVMVLHSLGRGAPTSGSLRYAQMSLFEPQAGVTRLTDPPVLNQRLGAQLRGSSTEGLPKSSYKLELWDEFGTDQKHELLGLPAESDWVLYAPNQFDPILIHNPFIHQLSRDMGRYSSRTRFVEVYFNRGVGPVSTANYMGIYVLEEKIKIGPDRVDIDQLEAENLTPPSITGGYLLKIDRLDPGDSGISAGGVTIGHVDPKERDLRLAQRRPQQTYIRDYFTAYAKALSSTNWLDPNLGYRAYFDVEAAIDFHVLEVLSGNVDTLVLSTYFHKPRNGRITFGPHWDFDRALGSTDGRDYNPRIWTTGPFFSASWWSRMFADKDFWQRWVDRWQELRDTHFALTNLNAIIDRFTGEVRQAQPREYAKWRVTLRGGSYASEINWMKNWVSNRVDFIDRQLTQPARFSHPGGPVAAGQRVTVTGPAGATLYYTLDGTDPRATGGAISPKARIYSTALTISGNARLVVRAYDTTKKQVGGPPTASSTPWSRPAAATYVVTTPPLLLTEIMFHPEDPPLGSAWADADFEFLEFKNQGAAPLELTGFRITNGVDFVFASTSGVTRLAPGERVLVVRNRAAFQSRYPGVGNIAGVFTGSLGNGGNRITVVGPLGEPVSEVAYDDAWAPFADGFGFSLVLGDESTAPGNLGDASRWRRSGRAGGSPGDTDPAPAGVPAVWINEVVTNTDPPAQDWIELLNPGPVAVDVSGWYLTDDYREPRKYRLPAGKVIGPRGFLVLGENEFGAGAGGFALSSAGDEVYLFSADAGGSLTGYVHGYAFGPADPGVAQGIQARLDGSLVFVEEKEPTPGRANAGARVGPVVVSEFMYDPGTLPDGTVGEEFVELYNASGIPVPLFDPIHPASTWRLEGAATLAFPTDLWLPPHGFLVLVGFHPAQDLDRVAAFRAQYHVKGEGTLLGPWQGHLNNAGETIRLVRPGVPSAAQQSAGTLPYLLVEQVSYAPTAPWPTKAAGTGYSLARRFLGLYADDPLNWFVSVPGPGVLDSDGDGLPDDWELANGLNPFSPLGENGAVGDPDRNGVNNRTAYWTDQPAWFGPTTLTTDREHAFPGTLTLNFTVEPGHVYTLLGSPAPVGSEWTVERTWSGFATRASVTFSVELAGEARWFRVRVD